MFHRRKLCLSEDCCEKPNNISNQDSNLSNTLENTIPATTNIQKNKLPDKKKINQIKNKIAQVDQLNLTSKQKEKTKKNLKLKLSKASQTTIVLHSFYPFTGLNTHIPNYNTTINNDVYYLTNSGFIYCDNNRNIKKNTILGNYKIIEDISGSFKVQYTINKGKFWSDGTPITGVDLLLNHIISSSNYSKTAGLGDPDSNNELAFNSMYYGLEYDKNITSVQLSNDKMSVIHTYNKYFHSWELFAPIIFPVHTLVHLVNGLIKLQPLATNNLAKNQFLNWFNKKDTTKLKMMGSIWSNIYNISLINETTNPLLLVSNGGFKIKSLIENNEITLIKNPKYNCGPKFVDANFTTLVIKTIGDRTATLQALQNGTIDIYNAEATIESVTALKKLSNIKIIEGKNACYEHIDLRVGSVTDTSYNGPFAYSNNNIDNMKSNDLRNAFLLAYPREQIVNELIKPIVNNSTVLNSLIKLPGESNYDTIVENSGVCKFALRTQQYRTLHALNLVKKYYPNASSTNQVINIKLLYGQPSNTRRVAEANFVKSELAKAGFNVDITPTSGWGSYLEDNSYDAHFYAWCPSNCGDIDNSSYLYTSNGGNNFIGYKNQLIDNIYKQIDLERSPEKRNQLYIEAEQILIEDAITLPIFEHPTIYAVNKNVDNIKPSINSVVWNYWEWKYIL